MKYLRYFFIIILSIAFTLVLTVGIFSYSTNSFMSKRNAVKLSNEIDSKKILKPNIKINADIEIDYLEVPEVKELLDSYIANSMDYIIKNEDIPKITDADIEKIINSDYYQRVLGINLSKEEKEEYFNQLKDIYVDYNNTLEKDLVTIKNEIYENEILKVILAEGFISKIAVLLIVLIILVWFFRWSWYRPLSWIGISAILAGGLNIILNIILIPEMFENQNDFLTNFITENLLEKWLKDGIMVVLFGLTLLIIYFILRSIFNKNEEEKLLDSL